MKIPWFNPDVLPENVDEISNIPVRAVVSIREWREGVEIIALHTPNRPFKFFSVWKNPPRVIVLEKIQSLDEGKGELLVVEFVAAIKRYSSDHQTDPLRDPYLVIEPLNNKYKFSIMEGIVFPPLGNIPEK
jgi:hypothetical protein